MTRRLTAAFALCAVCALGAPAAAGAQQSTTAVPGATTTAPTATASAPGATPTATAPPATATAPPATATAPPATTTAPPATTAVPPVTTAAPAPAPAATTASDSGTDAGDRVAILLLLAVAVLAVLGAVLCALAYWQAWEPLWLARWRHATGEAGWRAGNAWSEFTDWLRLGR